MENDGKMMAKNGKGRMENDGKEWKSDGKMMAKGWQIMAK